MPFLDEARCSSTSSEPDVARAAERINTAWQKGIIEIIETGRLLIAHASAGMTSRASGRGHRHKSIALSNATLDDRTDRQGRRRAAAIWTTGLRGA